MMTSLIIISLIVILVIVAGLYFSFKSNESTVVSSTNVSKPLTKQIDALDRIESAIKDKIGEVKSGK